MSNNIRRIQLAEKQLILDFLNEHWGSRHPLVNHEVLFNYYFLDGEMTNFYVLEDGDGVAAICGYINCSSEENCDIWISIWCAKKGKNGLGLALVKRIIDLHRGSCSVQNTRLSSDPDAPTALEFGFTLPVS